MRISTNIGENRNPRKVGYASSQDPSKDIDELTYYGCGVIYSEDPGLDKLELKRCLEYLEEGDILTILDLKHISPSETEFRIFFDNLSEKGVTINGFIPSEFEDNLRFAYGEPQLQVNSTNT